MTTIAELAGEVYSQRERKTRDNGDAFECFKDGAPEWMTDVMHAAHDTMFPDDWRYACAFAACSEIHDCAEDRDADELQDLAHEFADGYVDTYTAARTAWLASNLHRLAYCDEAVEEGLVAADADISDRIAVGQYAEALEVFGAVVGALAERANELSDTEV